MRNLGQHINTARMSRNYLQNRQGTTGEAQFFSTVERTTPVRPPTIESDVFVPAATALLIGAGTFTIVTPLAVIIFNAVHWDLLAAVSTGVVFGGIGFGIAALDAIQACRASLYATDVLKDNLMARSGESTTETVQRDVVEFRVTRADLSESYPPVQIREMPVDVERMRAFLSAAVSGEPLTQAEWVGGDKLFSRSEYDAVMESLMELGMIVWKSSRDAAQGRVVTAGGRHAIRAWLDGRAPALRASAQASSLEG